MQDSKTLEFGESRIQVTLEQVELPTGEVIGLKAMIAYGQGANGLTGKVDNHYGKLIGATLINAVLQIGVRSAAGTPGAGAYYQNPVQSAAGDIGQGIAQDANKIVNQQIKVPPTITIPAFTICSIALGENITFARKPVLVR